MIAGSQCRAARALVQVTREKLSFRSGVDGAVIHTFERMLDKPDEKTVKALQGALEELGAVFVVRSHQIEYLRPAFATEEIHVRTWVASFRRASSVRRYEMRRAADEKVLATAATEWAFVDLATRLPTRIHPRVVAAFEVAPNGPSNSP